MKAFAAERDAASPSVRRPAPLPARPWPLWSLALGIAALYAGLFNHDFSVDALTYAAAVERGAPLFHSNHLLFNALHRLGWLAATFAGLAPERAIWWMQGTTVVLALLTLLALAWSLVPRAGAMRAATLAALLGCSFGFWTFAQEPEAYVPPLCCVAVSLALLRDPAAVPGWGRIVALSVLAALAVLLLQQHVFWYVALLWLLRVRLRGTPGGGARLAFVLFAVPAACLGAYLAAGVASGALGAQGLAAWLLGYGFDAEGALATYRAAPALPVRSIGLVLGLANLLFAYEIAMAPGWIAAAALVAAIVVAALWPGVRHAFRVARGDALALTLWLMLNLGFAFWWESRNIEFLLPVAFAAVALAGQGGAVLRPAALLLATAGLLAINAGTAFWPQRETPQRYLTLSALHAAEQLADGDRVIAEELNTVLWLHYFERATPRFLGGAVSAAMHGDRAVQAARDELLQALSEGRRVYTLEPAEHGRLRALAERVALLGRPGYRGEVESDLRTLYDGLVLEPVDAAPGAMRVRGPGSPPIVVPH